MEKWKKAPYIECMEYTKGRAFPESLLSTCALVVESASLQREDNNSCLGTGAGKDKRGHNSSVNNYGSNSKKCPLVVAGTQMHGTASLYRP